MNTHHLISRLSILIVFCIIAVSLMGMSVYCADAEKLKRGGELVASLNHSPLHLNPAIQSGLATAIPGTQILPGWCGLTRNGIRIRTWRNVGRFQKTAWP